MPDKETWFPDPFLTSERLGVDCRSDLITEIRYSGRHKSERGEGERDNRPSVLMRELWLPSPLSSLHVSLPCTSAPRSFRCNVHACILPSVHHSSPKSRTRKAIRKGTCKRTHPLDIRHDDPRSSSRSREMTCLSTCVRARCQQELQYSLSAYRGQRRAAPFQGLTSSSQ